MREHFIKQTGVFEGWSDKVYRCPAGKLTIGYGHNLEDSFYGGEKEIELLFPESYRMSNENGLALMENDLQGAIVDAGQTFERIAELTPNRQYVLIDMCFNMGMHKLRGFRNTFHALNQALDEKTEYSVVAEHMKDSSWYRQVGTRAEFLCALMVHDDWDAVSHIPSA